MRTSSSIFDLSKPNIPNLQFVNDCLLCSAAAAARHPKPTMWGSAVLGTLLALLGTVTGCGTDARVWSSPGRCARAGPFLIPCIGRVRDAVGWGGRLSTARSWWLMALCVGWLWLLWWGGRFFQVLILSHSFTPALKRGTFIKWTGLREELRPGLPRSASVTSYDHQTWKNRLVWKKQVGDCTIEMILFEYGLTSKWSKSEIYVLTPAGLLEMGAHASKVTNNCTSQGQS